MRAGVSIGEDAETQRLVARAQAGDGEAFEELCKRYRDPVRAKLEKLLGDPWEAEDATQEIFMKLRAKLHLYERRGGVPWWGWLSAVVHNHGVDWLRSGGRTEPLDPESLDTHRDRMGISAEAPKDPGWIDDPELLTAYEGLAHPEQQVLVLRYLLDRSIKQSAEALDLSETNVTTIHSRGVSALRRELKNGSTGRPDGDGRRADAFMTRRATFSPVTSRRRLALCFCT